MINVKDDTDISARNRQIPQDYCLNNDKENVINS